MAYNKETPTESEMIDKPTENNSDFITLNIYNAQKINNEDSEVDINKTETNLNIENEYGMNTIKNPLDLYKANNQMMFLDNTRQNPNPYPPYPQNPPYPQYPLYPQNPQYPPYPLSENRGVNQPIPEVTKPNNYSKSLNNYNNNNNYNKDNPYLKKKEIEKPRPVITQPNILNINKKKKFNLRLHIICCILLFFILPPVSVFYLCYILYQKEKNGE